jgi:hypothetical protein
MMQKEIDEEWDAVLTECRLVAGKRIITASTAAAIANRYATVATPALWACALGREYSIHAITAEIAIVFADAEHARLALGSLLERIIEQE